MVRRNRIKVDDAKVEFALLPCALEWVRSRYKEGDIYVFPELYFRESRIKGPELQPESRSSGQKANAPHQHQRHQGLRRLPQAGRHHLQESLLQILPPAPRVPAQLPRDQGKGAHADDGPPGFLVAHALRLPLGMGIPQGPRHRGPKPQGDSRGQEGALHPLARGGGGRTGRAHAPGIRPGGCARAAAAQ